MGLRQIWPIRAGSGLSRNNFPHSLLPDIKIESRLRSLAPPATVGVSVESLGLAGQSTPVLSVDATTVPLIAGEVRSPLEPKFEVSNVAKATSPAAPAAQLKSVTFSLLRTTGSSLASNVGPQDFTNPGNAEGFDLSTSATVAGGGVSNKNVTLQLAYDDPTGKDDLIISAVRVDYHFVTDNITANSMTTRARATWSGGSFDSGSTGTAVDYQTVPLSVDLYALGCDSWPKIRSLTTFIDIFTQAVVSATRTGSVQAVSVIVTASKTDLN
jgi:hypothetical protein